MFIVQEYAPKNNKRKERDFKEFIVITKENIVSRGASTIILINLLQTFHNRRYVNRGALKRYI